MNAIKAVFTQQYHDLTKNVSVTMMFILFPVLSVLMSTVMGDMDGFDSQAQTAVFIAMLVGTAPLVTIANNVAEDREHSSLRFMVMAGVRPSQYLLGLGSFVLVMTALPAAFMTWHGGFEADMIVRLVSTGVLGVLASAVLGAGIGIFAKNVQQASMIYTPFMMVLMFLPMLSMANETIERISGFVFTTQLMGLASDPDADLGRGLLIIAANLAVLTAFFVAAYRKKGLRG